ncbi:MAG: glycine zipper family protein [Methyloglobulus sp.]
MNKFKITMIIASTLMLSACYTQGGYTPTVDTYNDPNAYRMNQDMEECRQLASQSSGGTLKETAIGAGVGGLVGAAGGAVVGAFTGNPAAGAAIGAAAGGLGGAAKQGFTAEDRFRNAYNQCMSNRGHNVIR